MVEALLERIAQELERTGIPYMVIGGQALLFYGEPRFTKDIDITLGVDLPELERVLGTVSRMDLKVLVEDVEEFVKRTMVLPALDEGTGMRVDLMLSYSPYERQAIERARQERIGRAKVRIASLEDVIIHKVIAGRPKDLEDVGSMLLKNPDLDEVYIVKWLTRFDEALSEMYVETFRRLVQGGT